MPVGLRIMYCNSYLSGKGHYHFDGHYELIVQNLAIEKEVSIWKKQHNDERSWKDNPARYFESMSGNLEKWVAPASEHDSDFAIKLGANDKLYWDNNDGCNYEAPKGRDCFSVLLGREFPIVLGTASLYKSKLRIFVAIQNLSYHKNIGAVYTTDNWKTYSSISADYRWTMESGTEVWLIEKHLASASSEVEFALFYQVNGCEYWDNNFCRNYVVSSHGMTIQKTGLASYKDELWENPASKSTSQKTKKILEPEIESKPAIQESELLPAIE